MTEIRDSEPAYAKAKDKSGYPWYVPNIDKHINNQAQQLLENYSGIPPEQQPDHVHKIRDQAWDVRAYMCTGLGIWLKPYILYSPAYEKIVQRLKAGDTILDVGCMMGSDLRVLAYGGAPTDKMYAIDIVSHWDIGFDMYRDRDSFKVKHIESDFLSLDNPELVALHGKMDIISISAILHQWPLDKQIDGVKRLVQFSSGKGAMVVGHQIGTPDAGNLEVHGMSAYMHNPDSFAEMWKKVGEETGTKWETKARLLTYEQLGWAVEDLKFMNPNAAPLDFVVTRVE